MAQSTGFMKNMVAEQKRRLSDEVYFLTGNTAPVNGTSGTGKDVAGPGSTYTNTATGIVYVNIGTKASPSWAPASGEVTISLTSAQVKALRATPITMVPAAGAGLVVQFLGAELLLDYGGTNVFTEAADNLAFRYVNGTGVIVSQTVETTGFIDQAGDVITNAMPKIDAIATKAQSENVALVLHNTGAAEIAGNAANNNVVRVKVRYAMVATGW